jgi:hypothetical protein
MVKTTQALPPDKGNESAMPYQLFNNLDRNNVKGQQQTNGKLDFPKALSRG